MNRKQVIVRERRRIATEGNPIEAVCPRFNPFTPESVEFLERESGGS